MRVDIGIVVIGRDEGERLRTCLISALKSGVPVVYADSGSNDGSVDLARNLGVEAVSLDPSQAFTAARGRNAGLRRLLELRAELGYVQFIDGDCELTPEWLDTAAAQLDARPDVVAVCGRLRERRPEQSIYNRLCQLEWDVPPGEVRACGGIAMFRVSALREAGGFDARVVAGEEPELCRRLRRQGWKILRLSAEMAVHDAAMTRFGQWWKRQVRGGRGAMNLVARYGFSEDSHYASMVRSTRIWAIGWPLVLVLAALACWAVGGPKWALPVTCVVALSLPVQMFRVAIRTRRRGVDWRTACASGVFTILGHWPAMVGQGLYWRDRWMRRQP